MNHLKSIISMIALSAMLSACDRDFLERYPLDNISEAVFFKQPTDMMMYMNQFYDSSLFPVWSMLAAFNVGDLNSDNQIEGTSIDTRLMGTRTVNSSVDISWSFSYVRRINYFFDNYEKCTDDFSNYRQYVGEAYFFRALIYFRLLRSFGDVPYYTTVLKTNSPELYDPRTPRHIVVDNILSDLDEAARLLTDAKGSGVSRINKWIALLLQSRVALYEGTWQKYHANDVFKASVSNPDKYLNKAVEAALTVMNSGLYDVYSTGKPASDYGDLFTLRDYEGNSEILFWKKFSSAVSITNNKNYSLEYPSNRQAITKDMADSYLCTDGDPIGVSSLFGGYNTLSDEKKNRDPRFDQTIFTPEAIWMIDVVNNENVTTYWESAVYEKINTGGNFNAPTGYVRRKGYHPLRAYHHNNFEETPEIHYRYAEVLLNYAEAKAELGTITQEDLNLSIKKLRDRVGMPNINLSNITVDPDWAFPALSPVINEIRRERRIELITEAFRWDDIARWAAADELIVGKRPRGTKAEQFTESAFPIDAEGFLDPFAVSMPNGYQFRIDRDYLNPIPETQLLLNPQLTQNPNW